jgi:hypothetical protein
LITENRWATISPLTNGISQPAMKRSSPDAARTPAWIPPMGPIPSRLSVTWKSSIHRRPKKAQHIVDLICSVKVHNIVYLADKNGVKKVGSSLF